VTQPTAALPSSELNPETIERERERVNAQLAALSQKERQARSKAREATNDRPEEPRKTDRVEPIGEAFPHIDYSATDLPTESVEKSPGNRHRTAPIEKDEPSVTSVDTGSLNEADDRAQPSEKPAAVVAEAVTTAIADDSPESPEPSFGRKKVRKGEKFKSGSAKSEASPPELTGSEPSEDPKHPDTGAFEVEKQSFGRAKKKRTR
jgi:hypothetical protein